MKKIALLTLCTGLAGCADVGALPPADNSAYQGTPNYGVQTPPVSDSAVYELLGRLEQLQSEVQQLRGVVEEQGHTIADLQRRQDNIYSDLDQRIQVLASDHPTTEAPVNADAAVGSGQTAQTNAGEPAAPSGAAQTGAQDSVAEQQTPAPAEASEKERYQRAYEAVQNGHHAEAIKLLEALYADYPTGEFGDNAQYWLGESYKLNREIDKARAAYTKVITEFPGRPKAPDAMLKLGLIELEQQNPAKARDYFTRITLEYPGTTAASMATKRLAQMPQ
jgi:tol-pal system protein YbgF